MAIESHHWRCWQLADSAFPSGGFAHSLGIEALHSQGFIDSFDDLRQAIRSILFQQTEANLCLVKATHDAPDNFVTIDRLCEAMLTNHVARNASSAQGRAMLRAAVEAFPGPELDRIDGLLTHEVSPGHLPTVFGIVTRALDIPLEPALNLYVFQTLRSALSAAVRLGAVGPIQAQTMTRDLSSEIQTRIPEFASRGVDELAETSPLINLAQSNQHRLYSRLFQS